MVGALLVRADRPGLRRRRDLLQQRRLPRHVRPRHDRRRRHARPPGPHRARARTASRRPSASSTVDARRRQPRHRRERARATATPHGVAVDVAGHRAGHRRRRLGRQLVLPRRATTARRSTLGERRAADRRRLARSGRRSSAQGVTGADGGEIDHIELFGPPTVPATDSRNFVLCPGKAYDRSPCGTGTSAKLACLSADGKLAAGRGLAAGEHHRQRLRGHGRASATGRSSRASPGSAYVNAEADLILDERDPFCYGIRGACAHSFDVAIAGGGIVGAACAMSLRGGGAVGRGGRARPDRRRRDGGRHGARRRHGRFASAARADRSTRATSGSSWSRSCPPKSSTCRAARIWVAADEEEIAECHRKKALAPQVRMEVIDGRQLAEAEPNLRPGLAGGLLVHDDSTVYPPCAAAYFLRKLRRDAVPAAPPSRSRAKGLKLADGDDGRGRDHGERDRRLGQRGPAAARAIWRSPTATPASSSTCSSNWGT